MRSGSVISTLLFFATLTVHARPRPQSPDINEQQALSDLTPVQQGSTNPTNVSSDLIVIAGGDKPNSPPPSSLSPTLVQGLQAINFLENLESNFFEIGFKNLTQWGEKTRNLEVVAKVAAQELVHVATAETLLEHNGTPTLPACSYAFPVTDSASFFALADKITTVGVGAVTQADSNNIAFTFPSNATSSTQGLSIGWLNQANVPVYTPATSSQNGQVTTTVPPGLQGIAFAALVNTTSPTTVDDLTKATLAGPAIVPVS